MLVCMLIYIRVPETTDLDAAFANNHDLAIYWYYGAAVVHGLLAFNHVLSVLSDVEHWVKISATSL